MMSKIRVLILIIVIVGGLLGFITMQLGFPVEQLTYWCISIFTVFMIWNFKLGSGFMLWAAFLIFVLSGLLVLVGLNSIGETLMRLSLLGWIIGIIHSMLEYKRAKILENL